ncbi:hypothetical protein [Luteococcus sanguinis]|uniref:Uncharacterized protein n=1 Tax=Luteococcus sanguinis TaxID=174038 RepID=A0ABW1X390_9ACTN
MVFPQPVPSPPSTVHGCPQLEDLSSTGPGRLPMASARGKFGAFATPPRVMSVWFGDGVVNTGR